MFSVTFEINGRRVRPNQIGNELEKAMMKTIAKNISNQTRNAVCPVHGQRPRVICKGRSLKNLAFDVHGCCNELTEMVKAEFDKDSKETNS